MRVLMHGVKRSYLGNGNYLRKCQHRTRARAIWDLRSKAHESNATMEKGEKNSKGFGSPEKKEKKCEGGIPTYPRNFEGVCRGGLIGGLFSFYSMKID